MADEKEKKNKKISKMKASEVEQALKKAKESNNVGTSKYIQHLEARLGEIRSKA